jgi:hypothetical protein
MVALFPRTASQRRVAITSRCVPEDFRGVQWTPINGMQYVEREDDMPKEKAVYSVELEKDMMQFMEQMTAKYQLPDVSKAIRCLINYARDVEEARDDIFAEIRCLNCG